MNRAFDHGKPRPEGLGYENAHPNLALALDNVSSIRFAEHPPRFLPWRCFWMLGDVVCESRSLNLALKHLGRDQKGFAQRLGSFFCILSLYRRNAEIDISASVCYS